SAMLKELKLFIRNEFTVVHSSRLFYIVKIRSCECPHRLSDYIVKEQCHFIGGAGCIYYANPL
ncbi:hypothetical protein, partial [Pectobacterium sp. HCp5_1]|uniref:hypothetical protein n=1 Tax=Pectobacterium sp. HCp5_1 TaxID=3062446 RepID=UPI00293B8A2C